MALVDYLKREAAKIKVSFSKDKDDFMDYLVKYNLKDYFIENMPQEERKRLRRSLEDKLESKLGKYSGEMDGIIDKTASNLPMALVIANDIYTYISNNPIANATDFAYSMFLFKTALEAPVIYRYLKKTKDWYGRLDVLKHLALKPVRYVLPVIGPALEAGALRRMVRRRVLKEVTSDFIKEHGDYQTFEEKFKEKLSYPIFKSIERPEKIAA
jgi:hypothetical protein